jgi:hypothetical protein
VGQWLDLYAGTARLIIRDVLTGRAFIDVCRVTSAPPSVPI